MKNYFKIIKNKFNKQLEPKYKKGDIILTNDEYCPVMELSSRGIRYETGFTYLYWAIDLQTNKKYKICESSIKKIIGVKNK